MNKIIDIQTNRNFLLGVFDITVFGLIIYTVGLVVMTMPSVLILSILGILILVWLTSAFVEREKNPYFPITAENYSDEVCSLVPKTIRTILGFALGVTTITISSIFMLEYFSIINMIFFETSFITSIILALVGITAFRFFTKEYVIVMKTKVFSRIK